MKALNQAELLSIKRLWQKGLQLYEIADRIGITVEEVKEVLKPSPKQQTPHGQTNPTP